VHMISTTNGVSETTLSYASIMGLKEDLGLVGDQYSWLGSLFYFGKNPPIRLPIVTFPC
jgi:ACS family allantoate permease-like MFS transporter